MVEFKEVTVSEGKLATVLCQELNCFSEKPNSVLIASEGAFSVLVVGFRSLAMDLRALIFTPKGLERPLLVQINICLRPLTASVREIIWTACYEELKDLYAGTSVAVLDGRNFSEFMQRYEEMSAELQEKLDGAGSLRVESRRQNNSRLAA